MTFEMKLNQYCILKSIGRMLLSKLAMQLYHSGHDRKEVRKTEYYQGRGQFDIKKKYYPSVSRFHNFVGFMNRKNFSCYVELKINISILPYRNVKAI